MAGLIGERSRLTAIPNSIQVYTNTRAPSALFGENSLGTSPNSEGIDYNDEKDDEKDDQTAAHTRTVHCIH